MPLSNKHCHQIKLKDYKFELGVKALKENWDKSMTL